MANPIQQGLKLVAKELTANRAAVEAAAMANPIQQGLKPRIVVTGTGRCRVPQWLIQYNKD